MIENVDSITRLYDYIMSMKSLSIINCGVLKNYLMSVLQQEEYACYVWNGFNLYSKKLCIVYIAYMYDLLSKDNFCTKYILNKM